MAGNQPRDWSNWRDLPQPWDEQDRAVTDEELAELRLYTGQDKFLVAEEQRRKAFKEKIRRETEAFDESEKLRRENLGYPFLYQICVSQSPFILGTRN
jgi:demethoxyubiquinone hydroxylase (CLK1/Coq7/Cat5 family)